jgi:hypothetical protein
MNLAHLYVLSLLTIRKVIIDPGTKKYIPPQKAAQNAQAGSAKRIIPLEIIKIPPTNMCTIAVKRTSR